MIRNNPSVPSAPWRVLYNQDSTYLFATTRERLTPEHVDHMVDEVADGGADVMLINPNAQRVNYPSRVWQTFWDGYAPGRGEFFGPVPAAELPTREAWVGQMKALADQGCDYLARALARCRARGIVPGVSLRMNDMHDAPTPGTHLYSRFYMDHPELQINPPFPGGGWGARGFNYERPAVRKYFLDLIRELIERYDLDVLELDFLRFQCYFPRGRVDEHAAIMTGFIRDVRQMLDGAGRPIALIPRVAATPAAAYELGFDVAAWAREGLINGITTGAFLVTQWGLAVGSFKDQVGGGVPVYAGMDYAADRRPGLPVRGMPTDAALLRGFAAGHLAAGADGVNLFNFFCAREKAWEKTPLEPLFAVLREMGDLTGLRGREKTFTLTSGWTVALTDGPVQVPLALADQPRSVELLLAAEPPDMRVDVAVLISTGEAEGGSRLRLHVNSTPVGCAKSVTTTGVKDYRLALFEVPVAALRDGCNRLVFYNEGAPLTVVSLDVIVK